MFCYVPLIGDSVDHRPRGDFTAKPASLFVMGMKEFSENRSLFIKWPGKAVSQLPRS